MLLDRLLIAPSLNSLFVTGFILLYILFLIVTNFSQFKRLNVYSKLTLLALLSIAVGTHGLVHLGLESVYGFNPYKWF